MPSDDPTERVLLTDLRLSLSHQELRSVYEVEDTLTRVSTKQGQRLVPDLATISSRDNLAQAIIVRLLTPRGELAPLAHPDYGSRLHELIGSLNTETVRNLARLHILEALAQERRVTKVQEVRVTPSPGLRDSIDVLLRVIPLGPDASTLEIGPLTLEL